MDFVVVIPEADWAGQLPWFGGTVAEANRRAVEALGAGRILTPDKAPAGGKGVSLYGGLAEIPVDAVRRLAERGSGRVVNEFGQALAFAGAATSEGEPLAGWTRVTGAVTWTRAVGEARARTARRFQEADVLVEDPATLWADPGVAAEAGARIAPSVRLTGATRIGAGAEIGEFTRLHDTVVAAGARIETHSVLLEADVGPGAKVGPFARIRPGTVLDQGAYVGGFVETKNARIRRNAAVPHLSYVGDADVGVRANLGAGTITCNYDGRAKHRTTIGPGAFVGSNAILVAPVSIGRRAFVAAGSVVVGDVPDGAMAIARGRQVNKADRAGDRFEGADDV